MAEKMIRELFEPTGIGINGSNPWDIRVLDDRFYRRVVRDKSLGLGESYMDGWWTCARIDELTVRLLRIRPEDRVSAGLRHLPAFLATLLRNPQSRRRARIVAERHYNLGNDFFGALLDPYRQYSCAYFAADGCSLEDAQLAKMDLICRKLELRAGDHLLDIGCGWGGLAKFAAEHYGCRVTGVNISTEQLAFARGFCAGLPVDFLECDYRTMQGSYDKIVSVGMFEHVGHRNYRTFMDTVHRCLKPDGIFLLHTIGCNHSSAYADPWISKYIFPNGKLPGPAQAVRAAEPYCVIEDVHNLGPHYDPTLMEWNRRFQEAWPRFRGEYGERFKRMWEYYLLSCAGAFRARNVQLWQFQMTRRGGARPQPWSRESGVSAAAETHAVPTG